MLTGTGMQLALGAGFAVLFGAAGFLAQGRSVRGDVPLLWSAAGVIGPLLILVALYYRIAGLRALDPVRRGRAAARRALRHRDRDAQQARAEARLGRRRALFATGAVAALALAMTFALERGWLTVALALMVPGIAWIRSERPLPMLRTLAAAITVLVVLRIGWEPRIVGADVGTTPIFNWILYGYGVPAASFWFAGYLLRQARRRQAGAHGRIRGDPVHRAADVPGNPPLHERRRHLPRNQPPRRTRAAGLHRARDDHRP